MREQRIRTAAAISELDGKRLVRIENKFGTIDAPAICNFRLQG